MNLLFGKRSEMLPFVSCCYIVLVFGGSATADKPPPAANLVVTINNQDKPTRRETYTVTLSMYIPAHADPVDSIHIQVQNADQRLDKRKLSFIHTEMGNPVVQLEGYFRVQQLLSGARTTYEFKVVLVSVSGARSDEVSTTKQMPETGRDIGEKCSDLIERWERTYNKELTDGNPKLTKAKILCVSKEDMIDNHEPFYSRYETYGKKVLLQRFCDDGSKTIAWQMMAFLILPPDGEQHENHHEYSECMVKYYNEVDCPFGTRNWHAQFDPDDGTYAPLLMSLDYPEDATDLTKDDASKNEHRGVLAPAVLELKKQNYETIKLFYPRHTMLEQLEHESSPSGCTNLQPLTVPARNEETCYAYMRRLESANWYRNADGTFIDDFVNISCVNPAGRPDKRKPLETMFPDDEFIQPEPNYTIRAYGRWVYDGFAGLKDASFKLPVFGDWSVDKAWAIMLPNGKFDAEYARCKMRTWQKLCSTRWDAPPGGFEQWMVQPVEGWRPFVIFECQSHDAPCNHDEFVNWMLSPGWMSEAGDILFETEWYHLPEAPA